MCYCCILLNSVLHNKMCLCSFLRTMKEFDEYRTCFICSDIIVHIVKEHFQGFSFFSSVILILTHTNLIRVDICQCSIGLIFYSRIISFSERMQIFCQDPVRTGVIDTQCLKY